MEMRPDDVTVELPAAVQHINGVPFGQRIRAAKDLVETAVIVHAVVAAEAGNHVSVPIDEGRGTDTATREARRLQGRRGGSRHIGSIRRVNALTILGSAAGRKHLPGRGAMRTVYGRLRELDDGTAALANTNLLSLP